MRRPKGHVVDPHVHNPVVRTIVGTQEVLVMRRGKILISLYSEEFALNAEITLQAGDVILLAAGGHRIEVLEESEILEVKQGPYGGIHDKTHFVPGLQ